MTRTVGLLATLRAAVPAMQHRAIAHDRSGAFPAEDIAALRRMGALAAPVPISLGGCGMGTEPAGAHAILETLCLIGRGSLAVGRLFEAHVNALRLIVRYGADAQVAQAARDALDGHLFGLWVTDAPEAPVRLSADFRLTGAKDPCSGAGHATRAVITATTPSGDTRMLVIAVAPGERADLARWDPHGMRATASGRMTLDGLALPPAAVFGNAGDYLRQPDFSAGAWRTSAVTLGGLEALVTALRHVLSERGRDEDPHQQARVGQALLAQETARLWAHRAAVIGERQEADPEDVANTVNLARLAIEAACLEVITLVQRALGMAAFRRGTLIELLFRDLALYLRQPAPDATLIAAAAHFMRRDLPPLAF